MTQRDVANSLLASLASSSDQAPNFWLNPQNGVSYRVAVQTPQYRMDSFDALFRTPISPPGGGRAQLLGNLATLDRLSNELFAEFCPQPIAAASRIAHRSRLPVRRVFSRRVGRVRRVQRREPG